MENMHIFNILNKPNVLKNMSDDQFEAWLPQFAEALYNFGLVPLITYYNNTLKSDYDDYCDLTNRVIRENNIHSTNTVGLNIIRRHMPHIYEVQNHKGRSIANSWTIETLIKVLRINRKSHSTPYISEIVRQIGFVCGNSKVTMYRPLLTKRIVQYFGAKKILDVCVGWGGRMLGSCCMEDVHYTGIEPCTATYKGLVSMCKSCNIENVHLFHDCAEVVLPTINEKFDLAITSPPYYNLELYSDEDSQSHNYGSYESWVENFLRPVVFGVIDHLYENGKSVWSVKNFKTDKAYDLFDEIMLLHAEKGWVKMDIEFNVGNPIRPGRKAHTNGETRFGQEVTYVFTKEW